MILFIEMLVCEYCLCEWTTTIDDAPPGLLRALRTTYDTLYSIKIDDFNNAVVLVECNRDVRSLTGLDRLDCCKEQCLTRRDSQGRGGWKS